MRCGMFRLSNLLRPLLLPPPPSAAAVANILGNKKADVLWLLAEAAARMPAHTEQSIEKRNELEF
jgi:hypothetical protein